MEPWWLVPIIVAVVLIAAAAVLVIRRRRADQRAAVPREPAPSPADRLRKGLEATRRRLAARLDRALGTQPGNAEAALDRKSVV